MFSCFGFTLLRVNHMWTEHMSSTVNFNTGISEKGRNCYSSIHTLPSVGEITVLFHHFSGKVLLGRSKIQHKARQ